MTEPRKTMLIVKRISNVHCPVDNDLVAKAGAGVYPGNPRSSTGTVVDYSRFYSAKLGALRYLMVPGLFQTD